MDKTLSTSNASPSYDTQSRGAAQDELYESEPKTKPWWRSTFFVREPIQFGTWDGVYTSCILNVFGVVIFLRSGWVVGNAGIWLSLLMTLLILIPVYITVTSAIGICERSFIKEGGVYFLISHVLGQRHATAIGIVYCLGQAFSAALFVAGLAESISDLAKVENYWAQRGIGCGFLFLLLFLNLCGIHWVIRLQLVLLAVLAISVMSFFVGSFLPRRTNDTSGVIGYSSENMLDNFWPGYAPGQSFVSVLSVLFPTVCGIFTGVNMSGQLKNPRKSIPLGTLSALFTVTILYVSFILVSGAVVTRAALVSDYSIANEVSAWSPLLLTGVYVSGLSAALGGITGSPRLLQSIASTTNLAFLRIFKPTMGAGEVPVVALLFLALTAILCCLFGNLNLLAPLVTIPFLTTYTSMSWAYFCLAECYDRKVKREQALLSRQESSQKTDSDLDRLFPERKITGESSCQKPVTRRLSEKTRLLSQQAKAEDEVDGSETIIREKPSTWYSFMVNKYSSLFGTVYGVLLMFIIHWAYTLLVICILLLIYILAGTSKTALAPGVAVDLKIIKRTITGLNNFFAWFAIKFCSCCPGALDFGSKVQMVDQESVVLMNRGRVTPFTKKADMFNQEIVSEKNLDYADRKSYHQAQKLFLSDNSSNIMSNQP